MSFYRSWSHKVEAKAFDQYAAPAPSKTGISTRCFCFQQLSTIIQAIGEIFRKGKRTARTTSPERGSLTVEAALVAPLCLSALLLMMTLFQCLIVYEQVDQYLCSTVRQVVADRYSEDGVSSAEIMSLFYGGLVSSDIDGSRISGGKAGIIPKQVVDQSDDALIGLQVTYQMKIPGLMLPGQYLTMRDRVYARMWTGEPFGKKQIQNTEEEQRKVYVAENGVVYHGNENCTYIKLSVSSCSYSDISSQRNAYGSRYSACSYCGRNPGDQVYITSQGDAWHTDRQCSGLKRSLTVMTESEAKERGLRACGRCGG